jgi:hypothetical protein
MSSLGAPELLIILMMALIGVVPFYQIFKKAGYQGFLAVLMLIPLINLIMLFFLAFSDWPVLKQLRNFRQPAP